MKFAHYVVVCFSVAAIIVVFCQTAEADIYKYIDENGNISFTDDPGRLPDGGEKAQRVHQAPDDGESRTSTSFDLVRNHILVPVTVSYKGHEVKGQFVFDTGASSSLIGPHIARQLEIKPGEADLSLLQGVGGISVVGMVKLDSISIGPVRAMRIKVPVAEVGDYDGLLGNDLLKNSRFQVDYSARVIRWQ